MQNKGAIRLFAILLAVVSLYQLIFTYGAKQVEKEAAIYAKSVSNGDLGLEQIKEAQYLDSMSSEVALSLGLVDFTYKECKEKEINFGLDLKGGMNLILEVKVSDVLLALSNYNSDATFHKALKAADVRERNSTKDYVDLFGEEFEKLDPNAQLAAIFATPELKGVIDYKMSNGEVLDIIKKESDDAISNAFNILRTRIDRFGVTQPNIQKLEKAGRVLVELPGVKDPKRVRKLLQGTASLEFWETYDNQEVYQVIGQANVITRQIAAAEKRSEEKTDGVISDTAKKVSEEGMDLLAAIQGDSTSVDSLHDASLKSLYDYLIPSQYPGAVVGKAMARDTSKVNAYFQLDPVKNILPADMKLLWSIKPVDNNSEEGSEEAYYELVAIRVTSLDGRPRLEGDVITSARAQSTAQGDFDVSMSMNAEGAAEWARITGANVGKSIAVVLDGYVYSHPRVNEKISGGSTSITGGFTVQEAKDLANILKSGKLPAPARVVEDTVVGPSLGAEAVNAGLFSFIAAFILVLIYMIFYYHRAGLVANVALVTNVFFLFGVLASFGAVLTLPGLAGITLTLGMAVDANVIIYERIREELRAGKGLSLAITDGYKNAYSAIFDGNITTFLTAVILFIFGTGPIQGFATTLMIGIATSLFSAIFITRLIFERMLSKKKNVKFASKITENILVNSKFNFIGVRKVTYVISGIIILAGIVSMLTRGFNYGVDFSGGRNFVLQFDDKVNTVELQKTLVGLFENQNTEVKTIGSEHRVKITTKYLIDVDETEVYADSIIMAKLFEGTQPLLKDGLTFDDFSTQTILSSQKVGPTISDDIKLEALLAIVFALLGIFLYIVFRFKKVGYGLGSVLSLAHDALIVLGLYSLLKDFMPFAMDIDSAFIAAILTVIGYSINDTVIIYDRIREWGVVHPKWTLEERFNGALNSTLGRTLNTSLTTFVVLLIIFIFGGDVIRGFVFALLIGIGVGTYSSLFTAAPIVYDALIRKNKKK
ncbi:MAG: protein translocase subunit SecDF [Marinilabiliaceae bacterium]|nr:protein translocase subunit SecDF [Marinilabiliaceae bacterium]